MTYLGCISIRIDGPNAITVPCAIADQRGIGRGAKPSSFLGIDRACIGRERHAVHLAGLTLTYLAFVDIGQHAFRIALMRRAEAAAATGAIADDVAGVQLERGFRAERNCLAIRIKDVFCFAPRIASEEPPGTVAIAVREDRKRDRVI